MASAAFLKTIRPFHRPIHRQSFACRSLSDQALATKNVSSCPFKSLSDVPGEWEDIPFGSDAFHHYNASGMYKYSQWGLKILNVFSAEATKDVLKLDAMGKGKPFWPPQIQALLGESAFSMKWGSDHRRIRKVLNPLFTESAIAARFGNILSATDEFLETLFSKTANCAEGEYVHLQSLTRRWAWNIAVSVVIGAGDILTREEDKRMMTIFNTWTMGFIDGNMAHLNEPGTILGDGMIARKELLNFMDTIIARGTALGDDLDPKSALYGMLKESHAADWTADELREGLLVLLFASHDTTAVSTNNVVYAMHKYPEITEKLSSVLDGLGRDNNGNFEYDTLMECQYLDGFVKEALRFTPGVRGIHKSTISPNEDVVVNGVNIGDGQQMNINVVLQSRNEEQFENPDEFDPTRWINDDVKISKYAFTPFGMGQKMCLGWRLVYVEMKLMVALFQSRVRMEIDEDRLAKARSPFNYWEVYGRFYPK